MCDIVKNINTIGKVFIFLLIQWLFSLNRSFTWEAFQVMIDNCKAWVFQVFKKFVQILCAHDHLTENDCRRILADLKRFVTKLALCLPGAKR